jgi:hypothetical protein
MTRTPIASAAQAEVLVRSRRRCCICFGLQRDTSLKVGQIAHLDGDSSNPDVENLAFLCFEHHDRLDSRTSQSKNFTVAEVKVYREELDRSLGLVFGKQATFGEAVAEIDPIAGYYLLAEESASAELRVTRLADGTFHVEGTSLWGLDRSHGPNTGNLNFIATLHDNALEYKWPAGSLQIYRARLEFAPHGLKVVEENWAGVFGLNVRFGGWYARAA